MRGATIKEREAMFSQVTVRGSIALVVDLIKRDHLVDLKRIESSILEMHPSKLLV